MIVKKMRASFGKLHGELTLHEGMNLLCLPNEAGKSTWSAFLLTMLYGMDTGERAKKTNQNLPVKERYRPWDGSAMQGAIELEWNGRDITIERTSTGRAPMGIFRAYETASGIPVAELTAENCGRTLCGVERSVFERTAFIRQLGMTVTEDAQLEQRLNALVTTGEEGKAYSELERELKNLKNKCSFRGSGQIPRLNTRISEVQQRLDTIRAAQDEAMALAARREEAQERKDRLDALRTRVERAQSARRRAGYEELNARVQAQELLCRRLEDGCEGLPEESALRQLQKQLDSAEDALRTAQMEAAFGAAEVEKPATPPVFDGLTGEEAEEKAAQDVEDFKMLQSARAPKKLPALLVCLLAVAAGAGLCFVQLYVGLALAGAGLLALAAALIVLGRKTVQARERQHQAELIPARYGVKTCEEITAMAARYAASMREYSEKKAASDAQKAEFAASIDAIRAKLDVLCAQIRAFAPDSQSVTECRTAVTAALRARERLTSECRTRDAMRQQSRSMQLLLDGTEEAAPEDAEALRYDPQEVTRQLEQAAQELSTLTAQLAHKRGQISAQGDAVQLEAELEQLREQLDEAQNTDLALDYALSALKKADETLRSRFSPQITAEAGTILAELTGGKYPNVLLEPNMSLSVREDGGTVMRPAAAMSCGTADQMYLALRLAMCRRLLPPDAPLVLDDALVNFDDDRMALALTLLRREAAQRQIIFFSCHRRESEAF